MTSDLEKLVEDRHSYERYAVKIMTMTLSSL